MPPVAPRTALREAWRLDVGDYVVGAAWAHSGQRCAVGCGGGEVHVLGADGAREWLIPAHPSGLCALAWQPGGELLATAGHDGCARLWRVGQVEPVAKLQGTAGWVEHLAWSPDGRTLATASGRVVRLWHPDGAPRLETPAHASTVAGLRWSRGGDRLATIAYGGVTVWDVARGVSARELAWKGSLIALAWSPDDKVIACGSQDCSVHFWRLASGRDSEMTGYPLKPRSLVWDASSTLLATAGDATALLWDFGKGPEGTRPIELQRHELPVTALAFAPRRCALLTGAQDMGVILWEPRRTTKPVAFSFLEGEVTALAWRSDQALVLAGDSAGTVSALHLPA